MLVSVLCAWLLLSALTTLALVALLRGARRVEARALAAVAGAELALVQPRSGEDAPVSPGTAEVPVPEVSLA